MIAGLVSEHCVFCSPYQAWFMAFATNCSAQNLLVKIVLKKALIFIY